MTKPHQLNNGAAPPLPGGHWPFLDLLRFGAALLVLFGHTRGLLFTSFQDIAHPGLGTKMFYFLTGIHREGVAIFFAVSGFLVGGAVWRSIRGRRFDAKAYLASRFSRIYLVLLPALALALLFDWAGRFFLGGTRFFGERPLMPMGFTSDWTWPQMACNLAAVQGIFCKPLGVNPPLWSLGYEWVFYLIAPILFGLAFSSLARPVRVGGIALVLVGGAHSPVPCLTGCHGLGSGLQGRWRLRLSGHESCRCRRACWGLPSSRPDLFCRACRRCRSTRPISWSASGRPLPLQTGGSLAGVP